MSKKGEAAPPGRSSGRGVILTFHKVQPSFSYGATNCSPVRIDALLRYLQLRGFRFVSLEHAIDHGEPTDLAISFDDGYAHLANVLPQLMDRYGVRPTVFMPTAFIGRDNNWDYSSIFQRTPHLDAAAIKNLAKLGVEFGAHGHRHRDLTHCSPRELSEELFQSRKLLEDILDAPVPSVSYPFGRVNEAVVSEARKAGYMFGLTMGFPTPTDHPMTVGRLPIYGYDTPFTVRQKVERGAFYRLEQIKSGITSRLSGGTSLWRRINGQ